MKQVAGDCIWSDPCGDETNLLMNEDGFGESPRGGGAICFGAKAIDNFLRRNNLSYIIRAHEAHANGAYPQYIIKYIYIYLYISYIYIDVS